MNKYIKLLFFQMKLETFCDTKNEFMKVNDCYTKQMNKSFEIINKYNPDVIAFPEMSYSLNYRDKFTLLSKGRLIIAGSIYEDGYNKTIVFYNGTEYKLLKMYASPFEPMSRVLSYMDPREFIKHNLKSRIFNIKGKNIVILNCMEYYNLGYYIAREYSDIFGMITICSNSNSSLFKEESKAIHNHNESIYSFVLNCVSSYNNKVYADGSSYIYGPVSKYEKEWINEDYDNDDHVSSIINLDKESRYLYGEFLINNSSIYGRSDNYMNNPKNIVSKILI